MKKWIIGIAICIILGCAVTFTVRTVYASSGDMSELTIYEVNIYSEDIKKEYNLLFLADTHIVTTDGTEKDDVKEYARDRKKLFQTAEGTSSKDIFNLWMEFIQNSDLDLLLLGGDIVDFPSNANLEYLENQLSLLEIPYIFTVGNHDWTYPWDYMLDTESMAYHKFKNLSNYIEFDDFQIIAVDDCSNQITEESFQQYKATLENKKPTLVMLHVPLATPSLLEKAQKVWTSPVIIGTGKEGEVRANSISREFYNLTTETNSPVMALLAGHVHTDDISQINENLTQIVTGAGYQGNGILIHLKPKQ